MKQLKKKMIAGFVVTMFLIIGTVGLGFAAEITGRVEKIGNDFVLINLDDSYTLNGDDLVDEMVGKKVTVTGDVTENGNSKVVDILSMEIVEE